MFFLYLLFSVDYISYQIFQRIERDLNEPLSLDFLGKQTKPERMRGKEILEGGQE